MSKKLLQGGQFPSPLVVISSAGAAVGLGNGSFPYCR